MSDAGAEGRREKMQQALDEGAEQLRELKLSRSARSASPEAPPTFPVAQCHPVDGRNVEAGLHPVRCETGLLEAP